MLNYRVNNDRGASDLGLSMIQANLALSDRRFCATQVTQWLQPQGENDSLAIIAMNARGETRPVVGPGVDFGSVTVIRMNFEGPVGNPTNFSDGWEFGAISISLGGKGKDSDPVSLKIPVYYKRNTDNYVVDCFSTSMANAPSFGGSDGAGKLGSLVRPDKVKQVAWEQTLQNQYCMMASGGYDSKEFDSPFKEKRDRYLHGPTQHQALHYDPGSDKCVP